MIHPPLFNQTLTLTQLESQLWEAANILRLADMLLARLLLAIPDAQEMLGVTYPTAHNQVEKLGTAGILTQISDNK